MKRKGNFKLIHNYHHDDVLLFDLETDPHEAILSGATLIATVTSSQVIREGEVNKISDHYPVITDFKHE